MAVNEKTVILRIKLFGIFRETAGSKEVTLILDGADITVGSLKQCLFDSYPALRSLNAPFVVAVNRKVVGDVVRVTPADEVALLPLVSGG
ncbi:MAG: MoaD/ThiS family protein [Nitrososphaerota archaeon]|jgi:molybdopterin converting factor small subunit|nr:MoaD/ThiS family protein [Nitrososphaerota archaeon]